MTEEKICNGDVAVPPNNRDVVNANDAEDAEKDLPLISESERLVKIVPHTRSRSKEKSEEWELVPPDGGWGWLVLLGSMLVNILIPGTIKSFGVLFVEFIEAFDASPAAAAWIPALCYFLYSSLGPLSSILSVKYSYKTVTIIGGTFAAAGMMLTFWASSVSYLYVSYGVLVGTGAGLAFPPTVYIVTSYFVRLRGLANGLCISGSALGSIILPPVLRVLLEKYGYRGAVLIMGGITLNTWVAAIFYHPVEQHMKRVPKIKSNGVNLEDQVIEEVDETGDDNNVTKLDKLDEKTRPKFIIDDTPSSTPKMDAKSPENFSLENGFVRSASAAVVQNIDRGYDDHHHRYRKVSGTSKDKNGSVVQQLCSTSSLYAVPENRYSFTKMNRSHKHSVGERPPKRSPSTSSFQYVSTPYHGSTLNAIQPAEFASHLSLKSITNSLHPSHKGDEKEVKKEKHKFFDLSLLKDPAYLVILISNSTNAIGYTNFIILLPAYAISLGFDKTLSAYLLSIVSTLDLVGRIGGSALSDTELIPKTWYFIGGLAISGISLAVLPLAKTYTMLSVCCACFGLASGVYVGITAVIMADMLGTERLTSSYGISLFVNGILQLIGPPICGVWYESLQSYATLFHTLGLVLLAGSSLWGFMPMINRRKREASERASENEINL